MKLHQICLLVLLGLSHCSCLEKVMRAYLSKDSVEWFSEDVLSNYDLVDPWLSVRLNHENHTRSAYKYVCEFRVIDWHRFVKIYQDEIDQMGEQRIRLVVLIEDLTKSDRTKRSTQNIPPPAGNSIVGKYVSYYRINEWMQNLAKRYPSLVQVSKIGRSHEKRVILALKLTSSPRSHSSKPLFLYDGGIHAREWLSIATTISIIDKLINAYLASDNLVMKILHRYELHFIPLLNPDGYEYSRSSKNNRYWRKNRRINGHSPQSSKRCQGVDLNRNFDYQWMTSGSSANTCSEVYAGPYAGSEPEIKSITRYIMHKSPRWISHISFHSYGALWLAPFSYSKNHIQNNFEETCQKAMIAIEDIKRKYDLSFTFGSASFELYEASGCSEDWSQAVAKINHTYVIELRPDNADSPEEGFNYPESDVLSASQEIYQGLLTYMNSFITNQVSESIKQTCQGKLNDMLETLADEEIERERRTGDDH